MLANCIDRMHRCGTMVVAVVLMSMFPAAVHAQSADTSCAPRSLPWSTSFEVEGVVVPPCWTIMLSYNNYPYVYSMGYASSGSSSLALAAYGSQNVCMVASPLMGHRADSLHVGFQLAMNDGGGILQVGLVSDTADTATFTAFLTLDLSSAVLGYYEFYTDGYAIADTEAVAFRIADGRVLIDDVEVEAATTCRRPWHPQVGMVTHTSIALSWGTAGGSATNYVVRRVAMATADTAFVAVADTQLTLTALTPATAYRLDVAALCGTDTTGWMSAGLVVTDVACRVPLTAAVDAVTATAAVLSWQHDTTGSVHPSGIHIALHDITSTSTATVGSVVDTTDSYAFLDNMVTGHTYRATLQAVCLNDTSAPVHLTFMPLASPCTEGAGTATSGVSVACGSTPYSYSQMLYPADVLGSADTIYAIALRVANNGMFVKRTLGLYIGQTSAGTLSTNIVSPMMTHVADTFSLAPGVEGWVTVPFAAPLAVDTAQNIVVAVLDYTGNPTGTLVFGVHYEAYGGSLYATSHTQPFDPSMFNIPMYATSHVADMRVYGNCPAAACQPPAAVLAERTATSLTLRWTGGGDSTLALLYAEGQSTPCASTVTTANTCTLGGLSPSTRYVAAVATLCGTDTAYAATMTGTTLCGTVAAPYVTDFALGAHPCWQGAQQEEHDGIVPSQLLVSPTIADSIATLQVRIALHPLRDDATLRVGVATDDGNVEVWLDTLRQLVGGEYVAYLDNYHGTAHRLVIDAADVWLLRRVSIEPADDCLPPRRLSVEAVGADCATVVWQGEAPLYEVYLAVAGTDEWSSWQSAATQLTLTGLAPQTSYIGYVVAHCSGVGEPSARSWFHVATGCDAIRHFPYTLGFEAGDATLECWSVAYADTACAAANPVVTTDQRRYSGQRSLRFGSYNNIQSGVYDQYLVSPRIMSDDSIVFTFRYYKDNYDSEPFEVGVSTNTDDVEAFLWMGQVEPQAGQWMEYSIVLPSVVRYVAIRYVGQGNYYLYIDDLAILGPGCAAPQLTMVDEQADAVTLRWDTALDTAIVAITDGVWLSDVEGTRVAGDTYTFAGLQSGRTYTAGVRWLCPDGYLSDWTVQRVTTIDVACQPPAAISVDSIGYNSIRVGWTPAADEQHWQLALLDDEGLLWQSAIVAQPHCSVDGLQPNHTYYAVVRSYCTDVPGPWSDTLRLLTAECLPVGAVRYERVDYRTVILDWDEAPVADGRCRIEYGTHGFEPGTGRVVVSTAPCRIGSLDPFDDYDFYVSNYCEEGVLSDTSVYLFVPSGVGVDAADADRLTLMPNPAIDKVKVGGLEPPAHLEIVDATGRRIYDATVECSTLYIDVTVFAPGTYFVRVTSASGIAMRKMIVF